jgi:hypothetical protein
MASGTVSAHHSHHMRPTYKVPTPPNCCCWHGESIRTPQPLRYLSSPRTQKFSATDSYSGMLAQVHKSHTLGMLAQVHMC